jgi:acylphosphatase
MKKLNSDPNTETLSARVTGRVQGVGFRAAAVRQAHLLRVRGWVRNTDDGAVEVMIQGPHEQVDRMLSWLHVGPPGARVDEVANQQESTEIFFDRFEQR